MATAAPIIPSAAQYKKAFLAIRGKMHPKHYEMLRANYAAPQHTISVDDLAKEVGYKKAFLAYGRLGSLLCDELGFKPTMGPVGSSPNCPISNSWNGCIPETISSSRAITRFEKR